jgi:group I intron endonuclease
MGKYRIKSTWDRKLIKKLSGIYLIKSKIRPDKFYIGCSKNINARWLNHIRCLENGKHHCKRLQKHVNKYGITDLSFSIIERCKPYNYLLLIKEDYYIMLYQPYFNGNSGHSIKQKSIQYSLF